MNTVLTVKIDPAVKKSAQEVAQSMGLTLSALVNTYLRQVSITRRVELFAPEIATPQMEKIIAEAEKEIAAGEVSGPFNTVEEFLEELHKKPA